MPNKIEHKTINGIEHKFCSHSTCKNPWKPLSEFHKNKITADGYQYKCKSCRKQTDYGSTKKKKAKYDKKRREANPEYNKQRCKERYYNKKDEYVQRAIDRKMLINKRTPKWANKLVIEAIYARARWLTKITGELYVVDHIVPLNGKNVSGLHVENNLQILHWLDNASKYNKFNCG